MFKIKWRNRSYRNFYRTVIVHTGLRRYTSRKAAQRQIDIWKMYFRQNTYHVEPA